MSSASLAAALCLLAGALGSTAVAQTSATAPVVDATPLPRLDAGTLLALEREFWRCDFEATQVLLDAGTAMECGILTETLKARRFGGDFTAMLAWWRANKDAQHLAMAASSLPRLAQTPNRRAYN